MLAITAPPNRRIPFVRGNSIQHHATARIEAVVEAKSFFAAFGT
jgi:hypothetical protein